MIALVEAGIVKRQKLKDLPLAKVCPVDLKSTERQLTNNDLSLTYKVVVAGYGIAIAVFLAEITIKLVKTKPWKQQSATNKWYDVTLRCCNSKPRSNKLPELVYTMKNNRSLDNIIVLQKGIPRPLDENTPRNLAQGKKHYINGRDYYVVIDRGGDQRLIPIRTPSAFLFQYAA